MATKRQLKETKKTKKTPTHEGTIETEFGKVKVRFFKTVFARKANEGERK